MTSIKFHFRPSTVEGSDGGKLFVRLIHKRRQASISTGYRLKAYEWNDPTGQVLLPLDNPERKRYLTQLQYKLDEIRRLLDLSVSEHSRRGDYEVEDIVKSYVRTPEGDGLREYCEVLRLRLLDNGQVRTARAYRSAVTSLQKFMDENMHSFHNLDSRLLKQYEGWMLEKGMKMNTVSFYMRNLRVIYNKAVAENMIPEREVKPFRNVYTGVYQTRHRALTEQQLNSLSALEARLGDNPSVQPGSKDRDIRGYEKNLKLKDALNYFLFCFHARGMSYVDMAYLKKTEITGNTILYKRKKTGKFLEVKVTAPMRRIMEGFQSRTVGSPYVFPVIVPGRNSDRRQYETGLLNQNELLGTLSGMAGLDVKVTTHVARHTWASIAKRHNVDVAVISEALGHSSLRVTEIYLDSFERSVMDSVSDEVSGVIKTEQKAA